jgi:thioredoxin-related protein
MSEDLNTTERVLASYLKIQYTPTIVFLNGKNQTVLRLNGYRSPEAFKQALDFVQSKAYVSTSFSDYKRQHMQYGQYKFVEDPLIKSTTDLSSLQGPVALLFEDNDCNECAHFHQKMMQRPEIRELLKRLTLIRLDAKSVKPITGFDGKPTTPVKLAAELAITYRPGIVLFDKGKEVSRVESMLYPFHFGNVIRMALDNNHLEFASYLDLSRKRQQELLSQGIDINVGKPEDW